MNLDADIFVENDPQLKHALPTICDICRAVRGKLLSPDPVKPLTPAKTKALRESLDQMVGELLTVADMIKLIEKLQGHNTPVVCPDAWPPGDAA